MEETKARDVEQSAPVQNTERTIALAAGLGLWLSHRGKKSQNKGGGLGRLFKWGIEAKIAKRVFNPAKRLLRKALPKSATETLEKFPELIKTGGTKFSRNAGAWIAKFGRRNVESRAGKKLFLKLGNSFAKTGTKGSEKLADKAGEKLLGKVATKAGITAGEKIAEGGAEVGAKVGLKFIPFIGWAILGVDAVCRTFGTNKEYKKELKPQFLSWSRKKQTAYAKECQTDAGNIWTKMSGKEKDALSKSNPECFALLNKRSFLKNSTEEVGLYTADVAKKAVGTTVVGDVLGVFGVHDKTSITTTATSRFNDFSAEYDQKSQVAASESAPAQSAIGQQSVKDARFSRPRCRTFLAEQRHGNNIKRSRIHPTRKITVPSQAQVVRS